ncbi:hypothetical protein ACMZ7Q_03755 [Gardnerella vaginalis]|uniref:hypothetical protein n=1 Tax=Gardnerella vaginalis TaxID=2702 RepID=UPI0039EF03E6
MPSRADPHGIAVRLIWHVKHTVLHMPNHALKEPEIPIISDSVKVSTKAGRRAALWSVIKKPSQVAILRRLFCM